MNCDRTSTGLPGCDDGPGVAGSFGNDQVLAGGETFATSRMTAAEVNDAAIAGNSGPIYWETRNCTSPKLAPADRVTSHTPRNPANPPVTVYTTNSGTRKTNGVSCTPMSNESAGSGRSVIFAKVVTGMPITPKATATVLAIRQITAARNGSNPNAIRRAAGTATAVPNPAIASMKLPNPQAMINA